MPRTSKYQYHAFSNEVIDDIAKRFRLYFIRRASRKLTYREAQTLIDHESGPSPKPSGKITSDNTRPRVTGGGRARPTDEQVNGILERHAIANEAEPDEWDAVFDELMKRSYLPLEFKKVILMAFMDNLENYTISDELHVTLKTYYNYRRAILDMAAVIAVSKGLLKP